MPAYELHAASLAGSNCTGGPAYEQAWLAFDPVDHEFWVAAPCSSVEVLNESGPFQTSVNGTYPVGQDPFGVAVDNQTGNVYVTNTATNNVTVLDPTTGRSVANISVGLGPLGVAYDAADSEVYVANGGSDNVSVISTLSETVVASLAVGTAPVGVAVDGATDQVFVANNGSGNVSVIDAATHHLTTSIPVGSQPYGVAVDNTTDRVFVTDRGSDNISVIDPTTDSVVGAIPVQSGLQLEGIAYDPIHRVMWAGGGRFYAVVVNASALQVIGYAATDPSGAAVDPRNGRVCLTNTANETLICIVYPELAFPPATLQFVETGLPARVNWTVVLDWPGYYQSNITAPGPDIGFWIFSGPPAIYRYSIPAVAGYVPTPARGLLNVSLGFTQVLQLNITFVPANSTYSITFLALALPLGAPWSVDLGGGNNQSSTSALGFREPNGTYVYAVIPPAGYLASPSMGTVTIQGTGLDVPIQFRPAPTYPVLLSETGLPQGVRWLAAVNGDWASTVNASVAFALPNGTYAYMVDPAAGFSPHPAGGQLQVNGSGVARSIEFRPSMSYALTFDETGLPGGTIWAVELNGTESVTTTATLVRTVGNGSYPYVIPEVPGYLPSPANGTVAIAGGDASVPVQFAALLPPLSANFTYAGNGFGAGTGGCLVESVLLSAQVTGGLPPYVDRWTYANGSAMGALTEIELSVDANTTVTLTVADSRGSVASHAATIPLIPPPCTSGRQGTASAGPGVGVWIVALALVGGVVLAGAAITVAWFIARSRRRPPGPASPAR
jgi:YVTN family beta-propeller protein